MFVSFGMVAASYLSAVPASGLVQQSSGTWTGTTMSVTLPVSTNPTSTLALFVAGNTIVPTPGGWTLRESQVDYLGHYLYTSAGGTNSWSITTNNGAGTWYAAEIGNSTYDVGMSAYDTGGTGIYTTPTLIPTAGNRLIMASLGGVNDYGPYTIDAWTDGFSEVADICYSSGDYPMQGVAIRTVTANGVDGYATTATYSMTPSPSAIIVSFSI